MDILEHLTSKHHQTLGNASKNHYNILGVQNLMSHILGSSFTKVILELLHYPL